MLVGRLVCNTEGVTLPKPSPNLANGPKAARNGPERSQTVAGVPLAASVTLCGRADAQGTPLGPRKPLLRTTYCPFGPDLGRFGRHRGMEVTFSELG